MDGSPATYISYSDPLSLDERRSGSKLEKTSLRTDVFQGYLIRIYESSQAIHISSTFMNYYLKLPETFTTKRLAFSVIPRSDIANPPFINSLLLSQALAD